MTAQDAPAQVVEPPPIKAAAIDISAGEPPAPVAKPANEPAWRTSFGSERKTVASRTASAGTIDADIVLVQGIRDMRTLRRWFPAKHWKIVVSRQLLQSEDPLDVLSQDAVAAIPVTGVAVRYQPGLRVTAQDHLLDLQGGDPRDGRPMQRAGTAVRVKIGDTIVWALSVDLQQCTSAEEACDADPRLDTWRSERLEVGVKLLTGGRFPGSAAGGTRADCGGLAIRVTDVGSGADGAIHGADGQSAPHCIASIALTK